MTALRQERGAALTEFVLVVPLLLAIVYGSMYLTELGTYKIKAQEIARYTAWAFTLRPLSNYEDPEQHSEAFGDASDSVHAELVDIYAADLDATVNNYRPGYRSTMSAHYEPPTVSSMRQEYVGILPKSVQLQWAGRLSTVGIILGFLGIGTSTESLVGGPLRELRLNIRGQVRGRARLRIEPAVRRVDKDRSEQLANLGRQRGVRHIGVDLSRGRPNRLLRDFDGGDIQTTLIADHWRVTQGHSARPGIGGPENTHYSNMVTEVSASGIDALGRVVSLILELNRIVDKLPPALSSILGMPPNDPAAHTLSRPYVRPREQHNNYRDPPLSGQVDIFEETGADDESSNTVVNFETGALYYDPDQPENSTYLESLNERGSSFMGCPLPQERGCWESR